MLGSDFRRDALMRTLPTVTVARATYEELARHFAAGRADDGRLVIREDLPHIDVMRAGFRIGLTFSFEILNGDARMLASRAAA